MEIGEEFRNSEDLTAYFVDQLDGHHDIQPFDPGVRPKLVSPQVAESGSHLMRGLDDNGPAVLLPGSRSTMSRSGQSSRSSRLPHG